MWFRSPTCIILLCLIEATLFLGGRAINCYKCTSTNGSNPACEDPINTSKVPLEEKCMVPKEGHIGLFQGYFCIKIFGKDTVTNEGLVVRACAIKTMDSQCGHFKYQEAEMSGCILTCDYNGCNMGISTVPHLLLPLLVPISLFCTR